MADSWRRKLKAEILEPRMLPAAGPQLIGDVLHIVGTAGDDNFAYVANAQHAVSVNGTSYAVPAAVRKIVIDGGGGRDPMTAHISGDATLRPGAAELTSGAHEIAALSMAGFRIYASGHRSVRLHDSAGADTFVDRENYARMFGAGYDNVAFGFDTVTGYSSGDPGDIGWFYNLAGAHVYSGRETSSRSFNTVHQATAFGFRKVFARSADGEGDLAELHGSAGDDQFIGRPEESRLWGAAFHHVALAFDRVVGRGGQGGTDRADVYDATSDDRLTAWPIFTRLEGPGFSFEANSFDVVHAHADAGGNDEATLYDGPEHDVFISTPTSSSLQASGTRNIASGFELVVSRSTHGGADEALFHDSAGADEFTWAEDLARITGAGFDNRAIGYERIALDADQGGNDRAWLRAKTKDERYSGSGASGELVGNNRWLSHRGIEDVQLVLPKGRSDDPLVHALEFTLNVFESANQHLMPLGSGVAHPWKIVPDFRDSRRVLVITGQGETGGNSFLYRMDAQTLVPIGPPLSVGASASDVVWVGDYVIVTARGSNEIFLIDSAAWRVVDRATVFMEPIAAAAVANDRVVIASIQAKELQQFVVRGGRLQLEKRIALSGTAYDLTFDAERNRLYVNHPSIHSISEISVADGRIVRQYAVGGEPSYAGVILGRFYVASDRDGYVHFIDRATQTTHVLDVAAALNLNRSQLAVRGIDPTDIIVLDATHFVLVNSRQDSLLFSFDSRAPFAAPVVVGRFTGAAFGTKLPSSNEILLTSPSVNRIDRVVINLGSGAAAAQIAVQTNVVGVTTMAAVRIGSGPGSKMAVITSDHRLHLIDEFTHASTTVSSIGGYRISAWYPIAADEHGRLWLIVNSGSTRRLIGVSADGTLLFDFDAALERPFSMDARHDSVVVVDRTNQQVQYVDLTTNLSHTYHLPHQRPRHAEILAPGKWVVIHDTNPDIGVTIYSQGQLSFHRYIGGRWLAGLTQTADGRVFVLDFDGSVLEFDIERGTFRLTLKLPAQPMTELRFTECGLWAASPTASSVFLLRNDGTGIETIWNDLPAFDVLPAGGGAWFVTDAGLHWRARYNDAHWWK